MTCGGNVAVAGEIVFVLAAFLDQEAAFSLRRAVRHPHMNGSVPVAVPVDETPKLYFTGEASVFPADVEKFAGFFHLDCGEVFVKICALADGGAGFR